MILEGVGSLSPGVIRQAGTSLKMARLDGKNQSNDREHAGILQKIPPQCLI